MSSARAGHGATRLRDGRVYFAGGYSTSDTANTSPASATPDLYVE